jgi:hypothetical protein
MRYKIFQAREKSKQVKEQIVGIVNIIAQYQYSETTHQSGQKPNSNTPISFSLQFIKLITYQI